MVTCILVALALAAEPPAMQPDFQPAQQPVPTGVVDVAASLNPEPIVGPPAGAPLSGEALKVATQRVASELRCPVCQGLSVADSPSESAVALKQEVERLVAMGYSDEQCLLYFEASYGEFIRLDPRAEGLNLVVWAGPLGLLVIGLGVIAWMRLGNRPKSAALPAAASPQLPAIDPALQPYVDEVYAAVGKGV
jgi:cytochrome c-type biogenesis protein CcmH